LPAHKPYETARSDVELMIPFNRPHFAPMAAELVDEVGRSDHHSGDGAMTRRARQLLEDLHPGCVGVLLTPSCTHALELAALTLAIEPGDEVILPSFTFVSTANAFALRGATLRFVDVAPDTLCLDPDRVSEVASDRTRAIVPVHYGGVACRMDRLCEIADETGAAIIEDNAHGLFGRLGDRPLGTFGPMSTLSFHETKNVSCGEGGALVVYDEDLLLRAEVHREKGTNRSSFFRGMIDKYTWVDVGSSWLPSEFVMAVLVGALLDAPVSQARRHRAWSMYHAELAPWARAHGISQPTVPPGSDHPAHLYYLLLPDLDQRTRFIDHMKQSGVHVVFHYVPLHSSPMGRRLAGDGVSLPVTDRVSEQLVRLPLFADLSDTELDQVLTAVTAFRP
jgi:dTDP-4-amino-4,6-dideoxygalactose transaminase